jgi:hypothetical protein
MSPTTRHTTAQQTTIIQTPIHAHTHTHTRTRTHTLTLTHNTHTPTHTCTRTRTQTSLHVYQSHEHRVIHYTKVFTLQREGPGVMLRGSFASEALTVKTEPETESSKCPNTLFPPPPRSHGAPQRAAPVRRLHIPPRVGARYGLGFRSSELRSVLFFGGFCWEGCIFLFR